MNYKYITRVISIKVGTPKILILKIFTKRFITFERYVQITPYFDTISRIEFSTHC